MGIDARQWGRFIVDTTILSFSKIKEYPVYVGGMRESYLALCSYDKVAARASDPKDSCRSRHPHKTLNASFE